MTGPCPSWSSLGRSARARATRLLRRARLLCRRQGEPVGVVSRTRPRRIAERAPDDAGFPNERGAVERAPVVNRSRVGEAIPHRMRPSRRRAMGESRRRLTSRTVSLAARAARAFRARMVLARPRHGRHRQTAIQRAAAGARSRRRAPPGRVRACPVACALLRPSAVRRSAGSRRRWPTRYDGRSRPASRSVHSSHTSVATRIGFPSSCARAHASAAARGNCAHTRVGPSAARTTPQRSLSICTKFRPMPPPSSRS